MLPRHRVQSTALLSWDDAPNIKQSNCTQAVVCAVDCTRLISCAVICNYLHSHPAVLTTLIMTAKLNDVDPQAWLADVLARIAEQPASPTYS